MIPVGWAASFTICLADRFAAQFDGAVGSLLDNSLLDRVVVAGNRFQNHQRSWIVEMLAKQSTSTKGARVRASSCLLWFRRIDPHIVYRK